MSGVYVRILDFERRKGRRRYERIEIPGAKPGAGLGLGV